MMKRVNKLFLITIFFLAIGANLCGEEKTWKTSNTNSDWHEPNNWSPVGVPADDDDVIIKSPNLGGKNPIISTDTAVKSINIKSGAKLTLNKSLTVTSKFENYGTFDGSSGKLIITPPSSDTFTVECTGSIDDNKFGDIILENGGGKTLKFEYGNINVLGQLILKGSSSENLTVTATNEIQIKLSSDKDGEGQYLKADTEDIIFFRSPTHISYKHNYTVYESEDFSGGTTNNNGWIFDSGSPPLPDETTWTGSAGTNEWDTATNWSNGVPIATKKAIINSTSPPPKVSSGAKAKEVEVKAGATLDLGNETIGNGSGNTTKLTNNGTLILQASVPQKNWFNEGKIICGGNSTVIYNYTGVGTSRQIYKGPYNNLEFKNKGEFTADGGSIKVNKTTTINGKITLDSTLNTNDLTVKAGEKLTADEPVNVTNDFLVKGDVILKKDVSVGNDLTNTTGVITLNDANLTVTGDLKSESTFMADDTTSTKKITVTGNFKNTSSATINTAMLLKGDFTNAGSFTATKDVEFKPTGTTFLITGTPSAGNTKFANLSMSELGSRSLTISKQIQVTGNLLLSGTSSNKFTITGDTNAAIYISDTQTGTGEYLKIKTSKVYINDGLGTTKYSVSNSINIDGANTGVHKGWAFGGSTGNPYSTWTGTDPTYPTKWDEAGNWDNGIPGTSTEATIPSGLAKYPILSKNVEANKVILKHGAILDLNRYLIKNGTGPNDTAKITAKGTLKLIGTSDQKTWINGASNHQIILDDTDGYPTVIYYSGTGAEPIINKGPYYHLTIESGRSVQINADMTIKGNFVSNGSFTDTAKTVTLSGASTTITVGSSGSANFYNLTNASGSTNINGVITVENDFLNNGTAMIQKAITINNNFENTDSVTLSADMNLSGDFTNSGTFTASSSTVTLTNDADHTITGTTTANKTVFNNLSMASAGGQTLTIKDQISISRDLTLTGGTISNWLSIKGYASTDNRIYITTAQSKNGNYLKVDTEHVKINDGTGSTTYLVENSIDDDAVTPFGTPNGWDFGKGVPTEVTWIGISNKWDDDKNWSPKYIPTETVPVKIPAVTSNKYPKLSTLSFGKKAKAKSVTIDSGAELDLADQVIKIGGITAPLTPITNNGKLILQGTDGAGITTNQKDWFTSGITLNSGSTVEYKGGSASTIWAGAYHNLIIAGGKSVTTDAGSSIQVNGNFENEGTFTLKNDMSLAQKFTSSGTFNAETHTVSFTGSTCEISGEPEFYNLTIDASASLKLLSAINIKNTFTNNGTFDATTESKKVTFTGGSSSIAGSSTTKFYSLDILSTATVTTTKDIEIAQDLNNSGTFNASTVTVTLTDDADHTITGTSTATDTQFSNLSMTNAGGQKLNINGDISVANDLSLSGNGTWSGLGTPSSELLEIDGSGNINISKANQEARLLKVDTTNLEITGAKPYKLKTSKDASNKQIDKNGWQFCGDDALTWTGDAGDNDWFKVGNWRLTSGGAANDIPASNTVVTIQSGGSPELDKDGKAKSVEIRSGASLDLNGFRILTSTDGASEQTSKITNNGTLRLKSTNGTNGQKAWLEETDASKNITHGANSIILYHNIGSNKIWKGSYQNLHIEGNNTVKSDDTITVEKEFKSLSGNVTASSDISVNGNFTNEGTFTSNAKVTLTNTTSHTITGTSTAGNTKFRDLEMTSAGGKSLTIKNQIQVGGKLLLKGSSGSLLTINGAGTIDLAKTQDRGNGDFLRVASNIPISKAASIKPYTVLNSVRQTPSDGPTTPANWVFEVDDVSIDWSLIAVNTNKLYIRFSKAVGKPINEAIKIKDGATTLATSNGVSAIGGDSRTWKFTLNSTIDRNAILKETNKIVLSNDEKQFIYSDASGTTRPEKDHISDIGLGVVKVLKATSSRTTTNFDGDKMMPKLNTTITTEKEPDDFKLYFSSDNYSSFWTPKSVSTINLSSTMGIAQNDSTTELNGTDVTPAPSTPTTEFEIKENDSNFKAHCGFMFVYKDWLPCARMSNSSDPQSYDLWKFNLEGVSIQRGGVSIFNNVVDVSKNEQTSVEIKLKQNGIITIQIMTLDGSIVKTIERSNKNAGVHLYHWDGTNLAGNKVARGMYFVRIAGPGIDEIRKVMIIK